jgi:hypothetical protein
MAPAALYLVRHAFSPFLYLAAILFFSVLNLAMGFKLHDDAINGGHAKSERVTEPIEFLPSSNSNYTINSVYQIDEGLICLYFNHISAISILSAGGMNQ